MPLKMYSRVIGRNKKNSVKVAKERFSVAKIVTPTFQINIVLWMPRVLKNLLVLVYSVTFFNNAGYNSL